MREMNVVALRQHSCRPLQSSFRQQIIRTQDQEIFRCGPVYALVERSMRPQIFLTEQQLDTAVVGRKALCNLDAIICRGIVDDEQTDIDA